MERSDLGCESVRDQPRRSEGGLYRERNGREVGLIFELGLGGD